MLLPEYVPISSFDHDLCRLLLTYTITASWLLLFGRQMDFTKRSRQRPAVATVWTLTILQQVGPKLEYRRHQISTRAPRCIRMQPFSKFSKPLTVSCSHKNFMISNGSRVIVLTNAQTHIHTPTKGHYWVKTTRSPHDAIAIRGW